MSSELHHVLGKEPETEQMLKVSLFLLYRYAENPSLVMCKFFHQTCLSITSSPGHFCRLSRRRGDNAGLTKASFHIQSGCWPRTTHWVVGDRSTEASTSYRESLLYLDHWHAWTDSWDSPTLEMLGKPQDHIWLHLKILLVLLGRKASFEVQNSICWPCPWSWCQECGL